MKFLCLAYGGKEGWESLSEEERQNALAKDELIRAGRNLVSPVEPKAITVKNWDGSLEVADNPNPQHELPLAGFYVIEAASFDDVVELVKDTPCARAKGLIEIHAFHETTV